MSVYFQTIVNHSHRADVYLVEKRTVFIAHSIAVTLNYWVSNCVNMLHHTGTETQVAICCELCENKIFYDMVPVRICLTNVARISCIVTLLVMHRFSLKGRMLNYIHAQEFLHMFLIEVVKYQSQFQSC